MLILLAACGTDPQGAEEVRPLPAPCPKVAQPTPPRA